MRKIKTLARVGFKTILFVLMPVVVFTLVTSKTAFIGGIKSFIVMTGSMQPTVPVGSIAFVQKQRVYDIGDVVTYQHGDVSITHRVVQKFYKDDGVYYQTKGDANNVADSELVKQSDIIGKGIFQIQYAGKIIVFMKTLQGFLSLVIFPTLLFVGFELWGIKNEIVKETEKRVLKKMEGNGQTILGLSNT